MQRRTVNSEITRVNYILTGFLVLAVSVFLSADIYDLEKSKAYTAIKIHNEAMRYFVEGYLLEIHNIVEILSENSKVINARNSEETCRDALELYEAYTRINNRITYLYSGYDDGLLLINDYDPPPGYDARLRPWYLLAKESAPDTSPGLVYQDAANGEWLVSFAKELPGGRGVISADSSIEMIDGMLAARSEGYESSYSYAVNTDGIILIHHDESHLGKRMSDVINVEVVLDGESGTFEYELEGTPKVAFYSRIENAEWIIVTAVEKREIFLPVIHSIVAVVLLITLVVTLFSAVQIRLLRIRIAKPILELYRRINIIVKGEPVEDNGYMFPSNEIGIIVARVSELSEHELLEKSRELQDTNNRIQIANEALQQKNETLDRLSSIDQLTELNNRRILDRELEREHRRSVRTGRSFSILFIDIDHFKSVNDNHGHQVGDEVLRDMAGTISGSVRETDITGRWGGEEFMVLCPETDLAGAARLGETIRVKIENIRFSIPEPLTVSIGCGELGKDEQVSSLVGRADGNLYRAKELGRNRVES